MSDTELPEGAPVQSFTTYQITPPSKFSFKSVDWTRWIRRFERFRMATELDKKDEDKQVNALIYTMGDEADDILLSFNLNAEELRSYEAVKNAFEHHFIAKRNVIYERAKFNVRVQNEGEPVDNFITDLHCLAEHCEFGTLKDQLIRDRIVVGLRNKRLSEKLQLDSALTLERAMSQAKQSEEVKKQQSLIHSKSPIGHNIDSIAKNKPRETSRRDDKQQYFHSSSKLSKFDKGKCTRCLGNAHPRNLCPASDSVCRKCSKKGHWAKACRGRDSRSLPQKNISEISRQNIAADSSDEETYFLGAIGTPTPSTNPWVTNLELNETSVAFKIDSGADVTVIPYKVYQTIHAPIPLRQTRKLLMGPCNHKLLVKGTFTIQLHHGNFETEEEIFVVDGLQRPLLGREAAHRLNLINRIEVINAPRTQDTIQSRYPTLFSGLGQMKGQQYDIKLTEAATPFAINVPRQVPIPLRQKTKQELQRMEQNGVISRVDEPTEWCAPMVVTPKSNGKVRVCVDLTQLNRYVKRENHPLPTTETTFAKLAGAKFFSRLDANSGFWQIKLSERSRPLTTFITPWGRYCFNVLPFGISSGSEKFQKCMSQILEGLDGVECNIDDILVYGTTHKEHDQRLDAVLRRLSNANVTLNAEKCEFNVQSVKFLGQIVGSDGIKPDPDKIEAILNMPHPTNLHEVRSFLGMVNQFSKFTTNLAHLTKPIRDLLIKTTAWAWGPAQQDAFSKTKQALTTAPVLALYDPNKETKIAADASSYGLGAVVLQEEAPGEWKPVSFISRSMTNTESKYAQIEKEALAVTWACERSSNYIIGKAVTIETDHKPLVPLLMKHTIDKLPPRLQRYKMRLMRFNIKDVRHVPGKYHYTADTLSRKLANPNSTTPTIAEEDINRHVDSIIAALPASDPKLSEIRKAQDKDKVCQQVKRYCLDQWPDKEHLDQDLKPYYQVNDELTIVRGLLMKGTRIVIPTGLQRETLERIHDGHQGINKCRARANRSVWWPGLSAQVKTMVENCQTCCEHRNSPPEPLMPTPLPDRPWQMIASDLFTIKDTNYLLVVDYYSRYVEVVTLRNTTSSLAVINALKSIFARHGIPNELRSDNGPQYHSDEFAQFAKDWGFYHTTSSPRFPQSNGEAERAVRTVKEILKKENDPAKALLAYRSTPLATGYSPAQLLMGRNIRSTIPTAPHQLMPQLPDRNSFQEKEEVRRSNQKRNFDNHHKAREMEPLCSGTTVFVTDMKCRGNVIGKANTPRSYIVNTSKAVVRRNRIQLKVIPPIIPEGPEKQGEEKPTPVQAKDRPNRIKKLSLKARENLGLE